MSVTVDFTDPELREPRHGKPGTVEPVPNDGIGTGRGQDYGEAPAPPRSVVDSDWSSVETVLNSPPERKECE